MSLEFESLHHRQAELTYDVGLERDTVGNGTCMYVKDMDTRVALGRENCFNRRVQQVPYLDGLPAPVNFTKAKVVPPRGRIGWVDNMQCAYSSSC